MSHKVTNLAFARQKALAEHARECERASRTAADPALVTVCAVRYECVDAAQDLADALGVSRSRTPSEAEGFPLVLRVGPDGVSLEKNGLSLRGDFSRLAARTRPDALPHELVVRAAKVKGIENPLAIDATAGLGDDSFLLASAGFRVHLFERDLVIAALLEDALQRALADPVLCDAAKRMRVTCADSIEALPKLAERPDVVLLDPMFPAKRKSAQAKKKLQLIQSLETPCKDEQALLDAALAAQPRKIVIKRPLKGPFLAGRKPDYSLSGKAIRYDCIALAR